MSTQAPSLDDQLRQASERKLAMHAARHQATAEALGRWTPPALFALGLALGWGLARRRR